MGQCALMGASLPLSEVNSAQAGLKVNTLFCPATPQSGSPSLLSPICPPKSYKTQAALQSFLSPSLLPRVSYNPVCSPQRAPTAPWTHLRVCP